MLLQPINIVYHKNARITIVLGAMVMLLLFSSCSGKKKELGDAITERDYMAVMDTRGVTTLVSDSGVTRYRINTEEWLVFDRKNPRYWAFEKGVYLEKFDSIFQVEASIKADTAYFFNKEELWKLMGNVHIQNLKGDIQLPFCLKRASFRGRIPRTYPSHPLALHRLRRIHPRDDTRGPAGIAAVWKDVLPKNSKRHIRQISGSHRADKKRIKRELSQQICHFIPTGMLQRSN